MLSKTVRGFFVFLLAVGLLSSRLISGNNRVQAATGGTKQRMAAGFVTAPLFNQPAGTTGALYISSWLDPDGSDFDQYVWDNFTLQNTETITEIDWIGGYDPARLGGGGPVIDFEVSIYPSITAGTEPAVANPPLVQYFTGGNAGETPIGTVGGTPLYSYALTLPEAFIASAGVKYWVQIEAWQQGSIPDWGIAAATGGNNQHYLRGAGAGGDIMYRTVPGDGAFSLLGLVPDEPTDIVLMGDAVDENQAVNTIVGMLLAAHPNPAATFTFSLSCTTAGADDLSFNISGDYLQTSASFNFESQNTLNICVRVTDHGGSTLDKNFVIHVNDINEAPTGISLSNNTVDENLPVNSLVGGLSATDPDAGETFTFSLSCATPGADDGSFNISGTNLQTSAVFDFETKASYAICVRMVDQGGLFFDKNFTISVNNINEPPSAFGKLSPANDATSQSYSSLTLTWQVSAPVTHYMICVAANSYTCDTWVNAGTATSYKIINLAPATQYNWQVRAYNGTVMTSANSDTWWTFTTQQERPSTFSKTTPVNGSVDQDYSSLTLTWQAASPVTQYKICVVVSSSYTCASWVQVGVNTSYTVTNLLPSTQYKWQVIAYNGSSFTTSNASTWWNFTTRAAPPSAFSKLSPANAATSQNYSSLTLTWQSSTPVTHYMICVAANSYACDTWVNAGTATSYKIINLAPATQYNWQVRAYNGTVMTSANSDTWWTFTTQQERPSTFSKTTPVNGSVDQDYSSLTLTWQAASPVTQYKICVVVSSSYTCASWVQVGVNTSYTVTNLLPSTQYKWQVIAYNGSSFTTSNASTWWNFTTRAAPPSAFGTFSPANAAAD